MRLSADERATFGLVLVGEMIEERETVDVGEFLNGEIMEWMSKQVRDSLPQHDWGVVKHICPIFVEIESMPMWPVSLFRELKEWLIYNAHGDWYVQFTGCGFSNERDAVLFKLFWYEAL